MKFVKKLILVLILAIPVSVIAGDAIIQSELDFVGNDRTADEVFAYYDLRNR